MDNVTFGHNWPYGETWRLYRKATTISGIVKPGQSLTSMNPLFIIAINIMSAISLPATSTGLCTTNTSLDWYCVYPAQYRPDSPKTAILDDIGPQNICRLLLHSFSIQLINCKGWVHTSDNTNTAGIMSMKNKLISDACQMVPLLSPYGSCSPYSIHCESNPKWPSFGHLETDQLQNLTDSRPSGSP